MINAIDFFRELHHRNPVLSWFFWFNILLAVVLLASMRAVPIQVNAEHAFLKPIRFAFSIALYSLSIAWFCSYLKDFNSVKLGWCIVVLLGFEIGYITFQACRGQLSHFNNSSAIYGFMFALMGLAAAAVSFITAFIALRFFSDNIHPLPPAYLWGIRIGLVMFVIFSLEGFLMGAMNSHSVGGESGRVFIPFVRWSLDFGDLRVSHFAGMHALQLLPLLGYYVLTEVRWMKVAGAAFFLLTSFLLFLALQGKPLTYRKWSEKAESGVNE